MRFHTRATERVTTRPGIRGEVMIEIAAEPLIYDSATALGPEARGKVVIAASHGGDYVGYLAALAGVKAIILNDAGMGKASAGVAGLHLLEECGIAAATISHLSARIGNGADTARRGKISAMNALACSLGVVEGMAASEAVRHLLDSKSFPVLPQVERHEARQVLSAVAGERAIVLVDSASLILPEDTDAVVISGSHGGLLGGIPALAIKYPVFAAFFNDAGRGLDNAGTMRLPALDQRNIAAATIDHETAKIGYGLSGYEEGVVSVINECAQRAGLYVGMRVRDAVSLLTVMP